MTEVSNIHPGRELQDFFLYMYGEQVGYVYSPVKNPETGEWSQAFFEWPRERGELVKHVQHNTVTSEVYYAPALFSQPSAKKEFVKGTYVYWCEFDGNAPTHTELGDIPTPSLRIRSSEPGHEHWYWKLDRFQVDITEIERSNRGLTYTLGADTSGWDADQVLRPPATRNHKRSKGVITLATGDSRVSPELFDILPEAPQYVKQDISLDDVPDPLDVVAKYQWPIEGFRHFRKKDIPVGGRSSAMMALAFYCAEMKMLDEEAFSILHNADERWGKFKNRSDRNKRLLDLINKARQKYPLNPTGELIDEFPVYYFNEFLAREIFVEWIIPGVLQRAGLVLLSGPPGTGKTQLSLQFSIHMALGKEFLGWELGKPQKIAFVSMEMGDADLKYFVDQMAEGLTTEERIVLSENLCLIPLGYGVLLDSPADQAKVNRLIKAHEPDGIIFDSLGVATLDELSSESTVKSIMDYIARLRDEHNLFVWFVHHNRKAQAQNKKPNKLADIYGSQYITAAATTVIGAWPVNDDLELTGLKVRLARPFSKMLISRIDNLNFELAKAGAKIISQLVTETEDDNDDEPPESGFPSIK
jgi:archaellum biogenesis ATPase FlaH